MDVIVVSEQVIQAVTSTATPSSDDGGGDLAIAWICTVVACLGFGSNYLPVKKCDTRDGQFFSLMVACGIFLVGFIQWLIFGLYKFEPIAMLGGVIWAAGNLFVPFIISRLGLGVGQLVWGATNMLIGWATGLFGLFGVDKSAIEHPALNYVGVGIAVCALVVFTQMGGDDSSPTESDLERVEPLDGLPDNAANPQGPAPKNVSGSFTAPFTATEPKETNASDFTIGFIVALCAGLLFGSNFDPCTILQQQGEACCTPAPCYYGKASCAGSPGNPTHAANGQDYVISHFSGVLSFTILAFIAFKMLSPSCYIGTDVVLPGLISGVLWGIAQVCWFTANQTLSYVVSFPIIVGVPGVIAALWGVFLFGENRSKKNMTLLGVIIVLQATSLIFIATSKGTVPPPIVPAPIPTLI